MNSCLFLCVGWLGAVMAWPATAFTVQEHATSAPVLPTQQFCPVLTDQPIDPEIFADYHNQRVYFCCDRCKVKFNGDPERYVNRIVSAASTAPLASATAPEERGHDHEMPSTDAMHEPDSADHEHAHDGIEEAAHANDSAHDHKEHGPGNSPRWLNWIGGFHPPMTNFPIGVLVAAGLAEALFIRTRRIEFAQAARFGIVFAVVSAVAAGALGWCFGGFRLADTDKVLMIHRWLGTSSILWMIVLLWASERVHRTPASSRSMYRTLLFSGAALVLATGFFGGAMVYGLDHYLPWLMHS